MKPLSCLRLFILAILLTSAPIQPGWSQRKEAPIVAREGSWVVEWTPKNRQCIVRFYSDRQQLIYQEIVDRHLNISRRKVKQHLNMALEQAMYVWNATHTIPTDRQWVAIQFDRN